MSKESGIGWTALNVDDSGGSACDIRNDVTNWQFATPRAVQDVTGLDKAAMERLLLLADHSVTLNGVFNPAANKSHAVFRTVPSTSVPRETSSTVSSQVLTSNLLYTDYSLNRAQDGSLTWSAPGVLADGAVPTWTTV
jgi:hypothetical protein